MKPLKWTYIDDGENSPYIQSNAVRMNGETVCDNIESEASGRIIENAPELLESYERLLLWMLRLKSQGRLKDLQLSEYIDEGLILTAQSRGGKQ